MSTITTITQAVYFTLRKNLGREAKKPKTPVISSFFKKLRSEQDKYNKAISPARKLVLKSLDKIYTSVLSSIHKKPRIAKPKVKKTQMPEIVLEQAPEVILDMPVITGKCSGFRIPTKSMKSAYKAPKVQEIEIEEVEEIEIAEEIAEEVPQLTQEELDAQFFAQYEEYKKAQEKPKSFWEEFDEMVKENTPEEKEEEEETEIVFMTASTEEIDDIIDQMNGCETLGELRKLYRELCLIHHPDKGGDSQVFISINETYQEISNSFKYDDDDEYTPEVISVILAIEFPEIVIDMPVCESVFETITYEAKAVKAVLVDFSDVKSEDSETDSEEDYDSEIDEEELDKRVQDEQNEKEYYEEFTKKVQAGLDKPQISEEEWNRREKEFRDLISEYTLPCEVYEEIEEIPSCEPVFEVLSTEATTESEFTCESEEEDFEDITQDFQVKSRRSVKISAVGLSAKAKKSLKVQAIKSLNRQK